MHFTRIISVILSILLLFLSFVPRVIEVLNRNFIFLLDQGRDYMAVKNIVLNHKFTLIGSEVGSGMAGIQGVFHGPFYFYLLSIPFVLFDGDPYGGVILMFIFGILTIIAAFILGRKIFNSTIGGLIVALLVAVSPPLIAQSRFIWSPHPSSFFIVLALYFTYLFFEKKKQYFFLAALFTGFIYNFEIAIAAPMSIALVIYSAYVLKLKYFKNYFSLFAGFFLAYSPFILFQLRHEFQSLRGLINYLLHLHNASTPYLSNHYYSFLLNFFDTFPKQSFVPTPLLYIIFIASIVFFMIQERDSKMRQFFVFLSVVIGMTFFMLSFLRNYVFPYYLIHLNFVYIFFLSYILISSFVKRQLTVQLLLSLLFFIFLASAMVHAVYTVRHDYSDYGGMSKIRGKIDAIRAIYNDAKGERFGLLTFAPPVYTYPYDYLVDWYARKEFHYVPHNEKRGVFYLLIEKDLAQPWTYKGWLETVIKTGEVIYTKELPSGFIIQKRIEKRHDAY